MVENDEKFLSLDKFKERVYKNIGTLESFDENAVNETLKSENKGCFGIFVTPLIGGLISTGVKQWRRELKIEELKVKADDILADQKIRDLICEKLDATVVLPIDAAYKITPVLYGLALEDEQKVPFNSMLFAIICRKIVNEGVENFCVETKTQPEKDKSDKKSGKKPSGD